MSRKLFVSDLDGTLLKIGNRLSAGVSEENRRAVRDFVAKGNVFAVASAREEIDCLHLKEQLGFVPDLIGGNGAILRIQGHVESCPVDAHLMEQVRGFRKTHCVPLTLMCHGSTFHYCEKTEYYPFAVCGGPRDLEKRILDMEEMPADLSSVSVLQYMGLVAPRDLEWVRTLLQREFMDRLEICSCDVDLLSFMAKGCTKGNGVSKLMKRYDIEPENVAVIGDSENDLSMIKAVCHGYCMDHAEELVKASAVGCVSSVAEALRDFIGDGE